MSVGSGCLRTLWVHLQEPEVVLTLFHIQTPKAPMLHSCQEADALAGVRALADTSVATADWGRRRGGHGDAQVGWCIAMGANRL